MKNYDHTIRNAMGKGSGPNNKRNNRIPKPGEIWFVRNLKYGQGTESKDRPIIIVSVNGNNIRYRRCTSQTSATHERYRIEDNSFAGLDKNTYIDKEILTLEISRLDHKIGMLSDYDLEGLESL